MGQFPYFVTDTSELFQLTGWRCDKNRLSVYAQHMEHDNMLLMLSVISRITPGLQQKPWNWL